MMMTLKDLKEKCLNEYGLKLHDTNIKNLTKTEKVSHKTVLCDPQPVITFCEKYKEYKEKGYKLLSDLEKEVSDKYQIKLTASRLRKMGIEFTILSRKFIFIKDWKKVLNYFDIGSASEKRKQTLMKRYGVESIMQVQAIKNKNRESRKNLESVNTLAEYFHRDSSSIKRAIQYLGIKPVGDFKSLKYYSKDTRQIIEKFFSEHPNTKAFLYQDTCKKKYNVTNVSQIKEVKQKKEETLLKNYGVTNFSKLEEVKKKITERTRKDAKERTALRLETRKNLIKNFEKENDCISAKRLDEEYDFGCGYHGRLAEVIHKMNIPYLIYQDALFIYNKDIDKLYLYKDMCKDSNTSFLEKEISQFIQSIYKGKILENNRTIIAPKELDIYIPERKVAIEFNGLYWHSEACIEDKEYHLKKTLACEEKGIRLLHIFEDDWIRKKEICKSIIASALGVYKEKIYAKDCTVKAIDIPSEKEFLNKNYIRGYKKSTYRFGLYYRNKLVQVISIGYFPKNDKFEILCITPKLNTQIIGSLDKLLKTISNQTDITSLYALIDRTLFNSKEYENYGFEKIQENEPNYFYFRGLRKEYPKGDLIKEQNLENEGFYRVYDCGSLEMKVTLKQN